MDAVVLALCSAALFGGDDRSRSGRRSPAVTIRSAVRSSPSCRRARRRARRRRDRRATGTLPPSWPFALAGILAPGVSQILFTLAIRDAGPSRASATVGMAPLFAVTFAVVAARRAARRPGSRSAPCLIVGGGIVLASE